MDDPRPPTLSPEEPSTIVDDEWIRGARVLAALFGIILIGLGIVVAAVAWRGYRGMGVAGGVIGVGLAFTVPACWPGRPRWVFLILLTLNGITAILALVVALLVLLRGFHLDEGCCGGIVFMIFFSIACGAYQGLVAAGLSEPQGHGFIVDTLDSPEPPKSTIHRNDSDLPK